jgi:MFS family permease
MIRIKGRNVTPHIVAILLFLVLSIIYFSPVLDGKQLSQHDTNTAIGASKEIVDYNKTHDDLALWTNSMFGGMPSYLIGLPTKSALTSVFSLTNLFNWRPVSFTFLYFLGFYIAMLLFGVNPWIAIIGALAFGFSSYNFIIIAAGHNSKAIAIGYMAPMIAGIFYAMRKNMLAGSAIFSLFLALQIYVNHLQITFYTLLIVLILMATELYYALKEKRIPDFLKKTGILAAFALLAIASNTARLWTTWEYGKYSIRGKSDLTAGAENKTSGLDKDYATAWSYGIDETLTLLIPNFRGGSSVSGLDADSESAKALAQNSVPNGNQIVKQLAYWGDQPFTSGPVYAGAIVCFLFILGLFLIKRPVKKWIIIATVLSIVLAWGHNFNFITNLFLDYFPGYNKFRTVSMILVIASFTIPVLAILALERISEGGIDSREWKKALLWSTGLTAGLSLIFALIPGIAGSFMSASGDAQIPDWLKGALIDDRKSLLRADAFRSAIFILLAAVILWMYVEKKLKLNSTLLIIGALILLDLWTVDKRYLNNDNFVEEREAKVPFKATLADQEILKDKDPDFRVLNITVSTFNDASTSYFHKSIGGYHGAKMRRYQELIDIFLNKEIQTFAQKLPTVHSIAGVDSIFQGMTALNLLNTKYLIYNPNAQPARNTHVLGSAWLVNDYKIAGNADQEIELLGKIDPRKEIVVNRKFENELTGVSLSKDTLSKISLTSYSPNVVEYNYKGSGNGLAVFSEIYYPKGWNAYVDGKKTSHFEADYVLRAMVIPAGDHKIEFRFEPKSFYLGSTISKASSLILLLLLLGILVFTVKKDLKDQI